MYTENGADSNGEWKVDDDGRFRSFWPPAEYTSYDIAWIRDASGQPSGIRFVSVDGTVSFEGRYA